MEASGPVDGNIAFTTVQSRCTFHTTTRTDTTEFEQPIEDRTIVSDVILSLLLRERVHIVRCDLLEKVDVFIGMELGHLKSSGWFRTL